MQVREKTISGLKTEESKFMFQVQGWKYMMNWELQPLFSLLDSEHGGSCQLDSF